MKALEHKLVPVSALARSFAEEQGLQELPITRSCRFGRAVASKADGYWLKADW